MAGLISPAIFLRAGSIFFIFGRDLCQSRNRPEPTTIAEPMSRPIVGTSPHSAKPKPIAQISDRYWNGTTAEVGARWIARVHQYWPSMLVAPLATISGMSPQDGMTKKNGSVRP